MSSTNKTTNYELSQFIGSDKPAWLNDYNTDMGKIDAGIHTAQTTATGADGKADANTTNIGTLANLTTEAKTSLVSAINEVDSHADTAQNTANSASSSANDANLAVASLQTYLDLNSFVSYTNTQMSPAAGTMGTSSITVAKNSAGTLGKIYGVLRHKPVSTGQQTVALNIDTGLRPATDMTITPAGSLVPAGTGSQPQPAIVDIVIKTNGYLEFKYYADYVPSQWYAGALLPCLYFIQNWGDTPTPE